MTFALPLGWTGSFDDETSILHLVTSDTIRATSISFGPAPERAEGGPLDRLDGFFRSETHRLGRRRWEKSGGRLAVGDRALIETRSSGTGDIVNGSPRGLRRRRRTGHITLAGHTYRVRHRSRWSAVVEVGEQHIGVLTRRPLSRRNLPLERTRLPNVQTAAVTEADQLAVVLAATVMGPPGRPGALRGLVRSLDLP